MYFTQSTVYLDVLRSQICVSFTFSTQIPKFENYGLLPAVHSSPLMFASICGRCRGNEWRRDRCKFSMRMFRPFVVGDRHRFENYKGSWVSVERLRLHDSRRGQGGGNRYGKGAYVASFDQ